MPGWNRFYSFWIFLNFHLWCLPLPRLKGLNWGQNWMINVGTVLTRPKVSLMLTFTKNAEYNKTSFWGHSWITFGSTDLWSNHGRPHLHLPPVSQYGALLGSHSSSQAMVTILYNYFAMSMNRAACLSIYMPWSILCEDTAFVTTPVFSTLAIIKPTYL